MSGRSTRCRGDGGCATPLRRGSAHRRRRPRTSRAAGSTGPPLAAHTRLRRDPQHLNEGGLRNGRLGLPPLPRDLTHGGVPQVFQGGHLLVPRQRGAPVIGGIRDAWARRAGERPLGYPITDESGPATAAAIRSSRAAPSTGRPPAGPHRLRRHPHRLGPPRRGERRHRLPHHRRHLRLPRRRLLAGFSRAAPSAGPRHRRAHRPSARSACLGPGGCGESGGLGYPLTGDDLRTPRRRLRPGLPGRQHLLVPRRRSAPRHRRDPRRLGPPGPGERTAGLPTTDETISGGGFRQTFQGGRILDPATGRDHLSLTGRGV